MTTSDSATHPEPVAATLDRHGISPTRQRREIASILLGKPRHVTAEQVMEALAQRGHRVSKATVYNTLRLFVDRGLLREIHADATSTVYDTTSTPHHHFLNVDTGELQDIDIDAVSFANLPDVPAGTVADSVEVIIRVRSSD